MKRLSILQRLVYRSATLYLLFTGQNSYSYGQSSCIPTSLKCENLIDPLGIDATSPRLSWRLQDDRTGAIQTAYQVFVSTDSSELVKGKGNVWQTRVISPDQTIIYKGKPLLSFTKYYWTVKVWDKDAHPSAIAKVNSFETAMLDMKNWKGAWISDTRDIQLKPAAYFRRTFNAGKKIRLARAYIAVAGVYELYINGSKISDHRLDPMYTRFDRRNLYVTHDITPELQKGENAIGVLLGNGWYNHQSTAVWYFHESPWRARPTFCMDVRITYEDGSIETISTGKDWKTSLSPVIFNSIYTAEHYDSRLEQTGWNTIAFNDSAWKEIIYRAAPSKNITAQVLHPVRNVETIEPKTINQINDTTYVFDLGRNISGVSQIRIRAEAGTIIRLKHGERLYNNGHVDQSNIDVHYRPTDNTDPFQTDIFIANGKGMQTFMPHFNYKGFQYIEVTSSKPIDLTKESLNGYFMHSDVPPVGFVKSSNPTLEKIWSATNNSYLSNLFGYPTDCPQREKNGWTGDAHIAVETGLYNFDGITIYEKWMADHRDEQQPNGVLPSIIPTDGWGYEWGNGPDWTSTIAIIPWNIYLFYGDSKILVDCYENIKRYVDHIKDISPSGLTTWGLGDWVPVKSKSPVEFTSSAYYFVDATILSKAAKLLGKQEDHEKYAKLALKIREAFNKKYLNTTTGTYNKGTQTELSVPLFWGLVPEELKSKVAANLARRVEADSNHIDVGLLGTKAILNALSENGYSGLAYKLASQETFPSWGWWMVNGATTLYENWPIDAKSDISMNHIMFGEIGAWLYKGLGGIKTDPEQPGFKNILLEPHFSEGLDQFEASHEGPYGTIHSSWKKSGKKTTYKVIVPPNSTATLRLNITKGQKLSENGKLLNIVAGIFVQKIKAGTYQYELE
ncbi:MAG: family 78 glycoside hydrolase catalytic domain [Chitinophagaceae bacterium]